MKDTMMLLAAAIAVAGSALAKPVPVQKKAIAWGWDTIYVNPEDILAHADAFDKTPFDGVGLHLQKVPLAAGGEISGESVFSDRPWTKEDVRKYVDVFRRMTAHKSLRESFLSLLLQPSGRVSFKDDAAWQKAANNFAVAAWLVKEGGLPGLILDTEDYFHQYQFRFNEKDGLDYDAACELARKRGRELFAGVFREYPEIAILSFYLLHQTPDYIQYHNALDPVGRARAYGDLWLPFVNGLFDVVPATARIIDGNEDSYWNQYHLRSGSSHYVDMHARARTLVEPENRAKFRQVFQAGSAVYLDMYVNPKGSAYYFGARGKGTRADRVVENAVCALEGADEYVWFYGEKLAFVPWGKVTPLRPRIPSWTNQTWEAALPGFHDAIRFTKDPFGEVRRRVKAAVAAGAPNEFTTDPVPTDFDSGDRTSDAKGLAVGAYYAFTGECRGERAEVRSVLLSGNDENWNYGWEYPAVSRPGPDGWRQILGLVRIGPDADGFRVFQSRRRGSYSDKVEFRNFRAYRLPREP